VFGSGPRDPNGPVSVVGVGRLAGEVATSDVAGGVLSDLRGRMATLVGMIASLNLALFAFNLIPLLPLDGGHVAGALWEGVKRTVARLRGRPDPGWVDVAKALPLAFAVAVVMVSMAVLLMLADVVNPIRLTG
jgi:membrane-associated protease RseP (regulator of RpoE activity)